MVESGVDKSIPRTLIVDLSDNFGGTNARILALIQKFSPERIGLATIRGSLIATELEAAGYSVHRLAHNKFDPRIPFRMAQIIRSHKYQIVDTQNPQSKLWGSLGAWLGGAFLVSTLNSWYMNEHPRYSLRWFIYTAIELLTNVALSRYIVVSREIKNAILRFGIPEEKIDLVYNAIDIQSFIIAKSKDYWTKKLGLAPDAALCVTAGRLSWAKGHDILIDAMGLLAKEHNDLFCLIAGEGELQDQLDVQIQNSGLSGRVFLLGHLSRPDLLSLTNACDIFVMPSRTEGTPIALLEAAALRKPILASCVGGVPELVKNEVEGLLIPPSEPSALAEGIRKLLQDDGLAERLAENAYDRVLREFSLDAQAHATIQSYNKVFQA